MKRAIISISDKTNIVDFASKLILKGYEIISTGGTGKALRQAGLDVIEVEDITGFAECLDGRVKTLHPNIHGGVLAIRDNPSHMKTLENMGISTIDLICVNLYPFKETITKKSHTLEEAIENIDIGGPSLIRAGCKNYKYVTVITDFEDYDFIIENMDKQGDVSADIRLTMATKAFQYTAAYDSCISQYLDKIADTPKFPKLLTVTYELKQSLRYGENSHQQAAYYKEPIIDSASLTNAKILHGKELSFNNLADADSAISIIKEFQPTACVAVKHSNPCAVALGKTPQEAFNSAYGADPISIFGGVLAFNTEVDNLCALEINKIFIEIVIAPSYSKEALDILKRKKDIRILQLSDISKLPSIDFDYKKISGGILIQDRDFISDEKHEYVTEKTPNNQELIDLDFAMKVCKHVKSNAIVIAKGGCTLGIGGGSVSRIWAAQMAIERAGDAAKDAVMASDAFFPFDDVVSECVKARITAIIQPGGSIKDKLSIEACNNGNISMTFTGVRHFKH